MCFNRLSFNKIFFIRHNIYTSGSELCNNWKMRVPGWQQLRSTAHFVISYLAVVELVSFFDSRDDFRDRRIKDRDKERDRDKDRDRSRKDRDSHRRDKDRSRRSRYKDTCTSLGDQIFLLILPYFGFTFN